MLSENSVREQSWYLLRFQVLKFLLFSEETKNNSVGQPRYVLKLNLILLQKIKIFQDKLIQISNLSNETTLSIKYVHPDLDIVRCCM